MHTLYSTYSRKKNYSDKKILDNPKLEKWDFLKEKKKKICVALSRVRRKTFQVLEMVNFMQCSLCICWLFIVSGRFWRRDKNIWSLIDWLIE